MMPPRLCTTNASGFCTTVSYGPEAIHQAGRCILRYQSLVQAELTDLGHAERYCSYCWPRKDLQ
jgi:hypothetical protein